MPSSLLWGLSSLGNVYTLQNTNNRWQQVSSLGAVYSFKKLAAAPNGVWGLGSDHQVYIYVFSSAVPIRVQEATFENERWNPVHGWTGDHLLPTDRWHWSSKDGLRHLPRSYFWLTSSDWEWEGEWLIDENFHGQITDKGGWQYATEFSGIYHPKPKWRSFVRRRRWMRYRRYTATDRWSQVPSVHIDPLQEPIVDLSVGGQQMHNVPQGFLSVWVITIRGKIVHRYGISCDNPKGLGWIEVSTAQGHEVSAISVGPSGLVWALTWSGQALVRMGVNWTHPYGTHWIEVEAPGEGSKLYSVAVGNHGVWAVSGDGIVWFRKGVNSAEADTEVTAATGTSWLQMYGHLRNVSMGLNDQVWGVGYDDMEIYMRTGVTEKETSGKTWRIINLPYTTCQVRYNTETSVTSSQGSSRKDSVLSDFDSPIHHQMAVDKAMNLDRTQDVDFQGNFSSDSVILNKATTEHVEETNIIEGLRISEIDVKQIESEKIADSKVLHTNNGSSAVIDNMTDACMENSQGDYLHKTSDLVCSDASNIQVSKTEKLKIMHLEENSNIPLGDVNQETNKMQTELKESDLEENESSVISLFKEENQDESLDSIFEGDHVDADGKHKVLNRRSSTVSDDVSDCIIDFVWDYPKDSDENKLETSGEQVRFIHRERTERRTSHKDVSVHFQNSVQEFPPSVETSSVAECCHLTVENCFDPECKTHRVSPSSSVLDEVEAFIADPVSLNSDILDHTYEDTGAIHWLSVSASSCNVHDEGEVALWFRSSTDAVYRTLQRKRFSYNSLREEIIVTLNLRNKLQVFPYLSYEHAVDQGTWVKKGKLRWWMDKLWRSQWHECSVELEQDLDEVTSAGSFTMYYSERSKRKHLQINLSEILAVCQVSDPKQKTVFGIYTKTQVEKRKGPTKLACSSLDQMEDWIAWLNKACCDHHGLRAASSEHALWATTDSGDILMRQKSPLITEPPADNIFWRQLGGHLQKCEASGCGVVWGIGYDDTAWVHTGAYGGGLLKGVDSSTVGINTQTDAIFVKIYEYQRWNPVSGYTNRGFLTDGYMWTDETTKQECTKSNAKLPSIHWQWAGDWVVDLTLPPGVTKEGWQYARYYSGPFFNRPRFRKSYIRRRRWMRKCKIVTSGPWIEVGPLPLLDVSVQHHPPDGNAKSIALWAIGSNGDVICRLGVTRQNPKGTHWQHVPTDQPFLSISVGTHFFVWAVAMDGSAWFRNGVSYEKPLGSCWFHVPPPPNQKLQQISAGDNSVWAVDTRGQLWSRQQIMSTFPEGTSWQLVTGVVRQVSVTADNQVWCIMDHLPEKSPLGNVICKLNIPDETKAKDVKWQPIIGGGFQHICARGAAENTHHSK